MLVNPPSLSVIVFLVLAEPHCRMCYFLTLIRLRQPPGTTPPTYEVAALRDLRAVREDARRKR